MNPFFSKEMADQHIRDLRREAAKGRARKRRAEEGLTVREATLRDSEAVRLLAALEGELMPKGRVLVVEVGDEILAALPLDGSRALADPFRRTAHLVELLELRAKQLRVSQPRSRVPRLRSVLRVA